jgi:hypothetical protein
MQLPVRISIGAVVVWLAGAAMPAAGQSLSGALGASNLHGLDDYNGCMAQANGAQEKLTAQVLQRKLNLSAAGLTAQDRQRIQQDIQWLNAKAVNPRAPAPDPRNSQRYLMDMSDDEQVEVNSAFSGFVNAVREKCEARYGGMSQFSDPSGRRPAAIDTRVAFPDLLHATPPAHQATAMEQHQDCMAGVAGVRWQLMAEHMEGKLRSLPNVSAQERKAWEEDIAVVRGAQQSGAKTIPMSPDPKNPTRYMTRLTPQEQMAMIQEQSARTQQIMAGCSGRMSAAAGVSDSQQAQRSRDLAAMHAERRAGRNVSQNLDPNAARAEAEAWLAARPFKPKAYATGSATQADYLEKSGALACYDRQKGFRAHQIVQRLETKRSTVAAADRQELDAWIGAWRAAERAGKDEPAAISPGNQQGWLRFLSGADQQEMNMANSALQTIVRTECSSMDYMK